MEKFPISTDDRLLDYLDGKLSNLELQKLNEELQGIPALQRRLEELKVVHDALAQSRFESPSTTFTTKVIQNLHRAT